MWALRIPNSQLRWPYFLYKLRTTDKLIAVLNKQVLTLCNIKFAKHFTVNTQPNPPDRNIFPLNHVRAGHYISSSDEIFALHF